MTRPFGGDAQVQLIAVDHQTLFETILFAYRKVDTKGADRAILHRAALATEYRADPDEVNRLRELQRRVAELDVPDRADLLADLERQIEREHGEDRSASVLARMELSEVRDAAIRWSVLGKRGAPIRVSAELLGLLAALVDEEATDDGFSGLLQGSEDPVDHAGVAVFPAGADSGDGRRAYRAPASVQALCARLDAIDRPTLDAAVDAVVGDGPSAEEVATWLEDDLEALTNLYRRAVARGAGLWYRFT